MSSKRYDVTVRFTVDAAVHADAFQHVLEALNLAEQAEQIPEWEILDVVEAMEPDEGYFTRINQGETAP